MEHKSKRRHANGKARQDVGANGKGGYKEPCTKKIQDKRQLKIRDNRCLSLAAVVLCSGSLSMRRKG